MSSALPLINTRQGAVKFKKFDYIYLTKLFLYKFLTIRINLDQ